MKIKNLFLYKQLNWIQQVQFLTAFFSLISLSVKADVPVFGNSPNGMGVSLTVINGEYIGGFAVEFTPQENISLSSVTLWLDGYTGIGLNAGGIAAYTNGYTINVSILNNYNNLQDNSEGTATSFPVSSSTIVNLTAAAPNNGTSAPFTFSDPSGSTVLSANIPYWIVALPEPIQDEPGMYADLSWVGGGTPAGEAVYDGSDLWNDGPTDNGFDTSSIVPAFTINTVPEPGELALAVLGTVVFAFGAGAKKS